MYAVTLCLKYIQANLGTSCKLHYLNRVPKLDQRSVLIVQAFSIGLHRYIDGRTSAAAEGWGTSWGPDGGQLKGRLTLGPEPCGRRDVPRILNIQTTA
jgi:hypothetical protein